ncbi:MAG: heparinase II/III-family protein [Bacteroidales bacterium]|nr:heparinase II/III-family protein [Bacteroidales bacterium]
MIKSLLTEYGLPWIINRLLYSAKLKIMRGIPFTEKLFEKKVNINRIDIFEVNIDRLEEFLHKLSIKKKNEIISIADNAIEGRITAFSSIELDYGSPINWHSNPITKVNVDKTLKWHCIPDFDTDKGDIKIIWEASRFTYFFYFARAYLITKNKKYYNAFSNHLKCWVTDNNYSFGVNYKCGQEATLRMINALIVYSFFKACGLEKQLDKDNIFALVEGSYKKILSNFFYAHKCIKNNHTFSEITGLIIGAWCSENEKKLDKAYRLLEKEIGKQFFSDGGYIQYSFNYQRFVLQIMEFILSINNKTKRNISNNSKNLLKKSVMLLYQMQDQTGDVPNYGSNDGALIFPVTSVNYRDFRPVINTVYAQLEGEKLYAEGNFDEELLWFGGKKIVEYNIKNIDRESAKYKEAGFYTLRNEKGFLMVILQNFKTRPAQMDQLHIDLWHNGINILCDSGTYSYATDLGKEMSLTAAHNTLQVDNAEQMKKYGSFLIYKWSHSKNIKHDQSSFSGTMLSWNGYEHTRVIKLIKNGYRIEDYVVGVGNKCQIIFHSPCEVKINKDGFELIDRTTVIAKVITIGMIDVKKSYRSLYYLKKDKISTITVSSVFEKNHCNITFEIILFQK